MGDKSLVQAVTLVLASVICVSASADEPMQVFLKQHNCVGCHRDATTVLGPSFKDIALHNSSDDLEKLINSIRNGSENVWGRLPMPAFRIVSKVQARCISMWIMSLNSVNAPQDDSCKATFPESATASQSYSGSIISFAKDLAKQFTSKFIEPDMVVIPAGSFMMGSPSDEVGRDKDEGPLHLVAIKKAFEVSKYEVTFDEWDHCVADGGCKTDVINGAGKDYGWGRSKQPLIGVNWQNAQSYIKWLNQVTGKKYRLLTEAEWEYAARAGTNTPYYWGSELGQNNANCKECGNESRGNRPMPVGSFKPNAFGLYDMLGNVREWTEDVYQYDYKKALPDGNAYVVYVDGAWGRVIRGGSWSALGSDVRSAFRDHTWVNVLQDDKTGFRLARTLP